MLKLLSLFLLIFFIAESKSQLKFSFENPAIKSEIFDIQRDTLFTIYFLCKIPYNILIFQKVNSNFSTSLEMLFEIKNDDNEVVKRKLEKEFLILDNYDLTKSKDKFIVKSVNFELPEGSYILFVSFVDLNSNKIIHKSNYSLNLGSIQKKLQSLVVNKEKKLEENRFEVVLFNNFIPHSANYFDLIVFTSNEISNIDEIFIKGKDLKQELIFEKLVYQNIKIQESEDKIWLIFLSDSLFDNSNNALLLRNVNKNLLEGDYIIEFMLNEKKIFEMPVKVKWFNKPETLNNIDLALEMIEFIEEIKLRTFFSSETEKKNKLYEYWKTRDPTPNTAFNELMNEFYKRVDYAQKEFASLSQRNGAKTDRGKTYIKNGYPDKVERNVNKEGKVVETWYYDNPQRVFYFIDLKGDGHFKFNQ